jgi:hypothetical protein
MLGWREAPSAVAKPAEGVKLLLNGQASIAGAAIEFFEFRDDGP